MALHELTLDKLEHFRADGMASRILGMGDVLTLIERAEQLDIEEEEALAMQEKMLTASFTLEDFRDQMVKIRKMGSLTDLLGMIPGLGKMKQLKNLKVDEREFVRIEAIINSMTPHERRFPDVIRGSRKKRIAAGSGQQIQDVNRLLKQHLQMEKMMKKMSRGGMKRMMRGMGGAGMPPGGMPPGFR